MSLVLARLSQGVLIVHNRWRKVWELPGGFMEPGETPEEGALREFEEETGLRGFSIEPLAVLEIRRHSKVTPILYCALYQCATEGVPPAQDTDEISEVAFWSPGSRVGPISAIDRALLEEYSNHGFAQQPHAERREG
jgi:8-oxo-dGTP diphosphatase